MAQLVGMVCRILSETSSWCRDERNLQSPLSSWQRKKQRDNRNRKDLPEKDSGTVQRTRKEHQVFKNGDSE